MTNNRTPDLAALPSADREDCPAAAIPLAPSGLFSFIGTAASHLERVERAISTAKAAHGPVADLYKRRAKLKARCAALGART